MKLSCGGYIRDDIGQDYADARYYSATAGSFWSPDPDPGSLTAAMPVSSNRFAYALGDPINNRDPLGLEPCGWISTSEGDEYYPCSGGDPIRGGGGPLPDEPVTEQPAEGGPASNGALLDAAEARIAGDLKNKPDCAADFKDVGKTLAELSEVGFKDYGEAKETTDKKGKKHIKGGQWGEYVPILHTINLNSNASVNWSDPSQSFMLVNGTETPSNFIAGELDLLGLPLTTAMSAEQFMDIVILHELAHYDGAVGDPDKPKNELKLWNDCVK